MECLYMYITAINKYFFIHVLLLLLTIFKSTIKVVHIKYILQQA